MVELSATAPAGIAVRLSCLVGEAERWAVLGEERGRGAQILKELGGGKERVRVCRFAFSSGKVHCDEQSKRDLRAASS